MTKASPRFFNTEGPVVPGKHYCIPPVDRIRLPRLMDLIARERYFVMHAPRQSGKTSSLRALRDRLNDGDQYRCVYVNVEPAQALRGNVSKAMETIFTQLKWWAEADERTKGLAALAPGAGDPVDTGSGLQMVLSRWASADPRPLVVLIDEIDSLVGDTLISVLRQLRAGYSERPRRFPQSVILCGVRDVRDYRIQTGSGDIITGGSAFNVKAESLRVGDFTEAEVRALLAQHTEDTGQEFTEEATEAVWRQTCGQPWLVNALALHSVRGSNASIDAATVMDARETLIRRRDTHIDQLAHKLTEDRVRRVIDPMLVGGDRRHTYLDLEYVRDLGLVSRDLPLRMANPIYAEVIPRELTAVVPDDIWQRTEWYVASDGSLLLADLLAAFQEFFRENSEAGLGGFDYPEATAQLLLQGFLQRIVNSGGRVEREYALGRRRTDLLILWGCRCYVIELRILRRGLDRTIETGVAQTADYMDRCGADEGHLVIFDRARDKRWDEKLYRRRETVDGTTVQVWGA